MTTAVAPHSSATSQSGSRRWGSALRNSTTGSVFRRPVALPSRAMPGRILVGTSSWADPGFVEDWYPRGMAARDRLAWYAQRFEYVEVNSSFYAVPAQKTVPRWAGLTPKAFTFALKPHRLSPRRSAAPRAPLSQPRPQAKT